MRYAFIRDHREEFWIRVMCRVLKVSTSGFYAWLKRPESLRSRENREMVDRIRAIHKKSRRTYGSPRVHDELAAQEVSCGKNRVARLMREHGIRSVHRKKFRVTTDSDHKMPVAPNLLDQCFETESANQKWVADITYVWTFEGWLYLAAVLDLYSRRIVGWCMRPRMSRELVLEALEMALGRRRPEPGLVHHSDRGSQYASNEFQEALEARGITCSMSRRGNCWDNAVMESFFHTLKVECVYQRVYRTRQEARTDIVEYIEMFYNIERRHSALGGMSPAEFEERNGVRITA